MKCNHCGHDPDAVKCQFCPDEPRPQEMICVEVNEEGFSCTREIGHQGLHVACGADTASEDFPDAHLFAIWET